MSKKSTHTYFWLFLLTFLGLQAYAQPSDYRNHYWYFGSSADGIQFNMSDNEPNAIDSQNNGMTNGSAAVVSDKFTGDLYFYTDGINVYNRNHDVMSNGTALNGNNATNQGVAVCPVPGEDGKFYIITNSAVSPASGTLSFTKIDMNAAGGAPANEPVLGAVETKNQPTGISNTTEAMVIYELNGIFHILVQESGTNNFRVYAIGNDTFTLIKTITIPNGIVAENFSITSGQDSLKVAVAPTNAGSNIQILQLTNADTISFVQQLPNTGVSSGSEPVVFDTEWSNNDSILYISRNQAGSQPTGLYRYEVYNPTATLEQVNTGNIANTYGLQKGPDGRIYYLYRDTPGGSIFMGRIASPDSVLALVNYEPIPLGTMNFNGVQFPAVLPGQNTTLSNLDFEIVGTCLRSPTLFYPSVDPIAENYTWDFGDGTVANYNSFQVPVHEYQNAGVYTVTLIARTNGAADTSTLQVSIIQLDDSVYLGNDTTICPTETLTLQADEDGNALSYRWSVPGETSNTLQVDTGGYYWVVADYGACTSYDGINVEEFGVQIQTSNTWYFGTNAGLDFNESPVVPLTDGQTQAPKGVATISDRNGETLFYTDGNSVWDRTHTLVADNIGGDVNADQSSIIIPFPNDETLYYIFTTEDIWDVTGQHEYVLKYSVFDIKEIETGNPMVVQNKSLFSRSTERMTATPPGGAAWLIAHEFGNNTFRAYPIVQDGIANPVLSSIGSNHDLSTNTNGEGYMKLSPDSRRLAVALSNSSGNFVEIFDFDPATGELSNFVQVEFPESSGQYQVYGVEFSSNSNKLFVTMNNQNSPASKIYELKLFSYDKDSIESSMAVIEDVPGFNLGAIQTGPDGQIYIAVEDQSFLGRFSPNQDTLGTSTYDFAGDRQDLGTGTSGLGLPNFVQNNSTASGGPAMSINGFCLGQPTSFTGIPRNNIDELIWNLGDGTTATTDTVTHNYAAIGFYPISLNVSNRCPNSDTTLLDTIQISEPVNPSLASGSPLCQDNLILQADTSGRNDLMYAWNTGETTPTITITQPSTYSVTITTPEGCVTTGSTIVIDVRPPLDLGSDMNVCLNEPVADFNTGIPNVQHEWYINGQLIAGNNTRIQPVSTATVGTDQYAVVVTDNLTTCVARDTVTVIINPIPSATTDITQSNCGLSDGAIDITSDLSGLSAAWFDASNTQIGSGANLSAIPAGNYSLTVTDVLSLCSNTLPQSVTDSSALFQINPTTIRDCRGDSLRVQLSGVSNTSLISYTLIDNNNAAVLTGNRDNVDFYIDGLTGTNYTLQITADGCTADSAGIAFPPLTTLDLSVSSIFDLCDDSPVIQASSVDENNYSGFVYEWTFPNGTTQSGNPISIIDGGTYNVRVYVAGLEKTVCDTSANTQVAVNETPDVQVSQGGNVCDGSIDLTATATGGSGSLAYLWSSGEVSPIITVSQSGSYSVTVRDNTTGCEGNSNAVSVTVYEPLTVAASNTPACQNENLVTLTATPSRTQGVRYQWFQNGVKLNRDTLSQMQTYSQGLFRIEVRAGACDASTEIELTRMPLTESNVPPSFTICSISPADEVAVIEPGDFSSYFARRIDDNQEVFESAPGVFELVDQGTYEFQSTNQFGCITEDTTIIIVDCTPQIVAPNVFSPQAVIPENRTFKVFPQYITDFKIYIYNRWGEIIFYSEDIEFMTREGWDGTSESGILLPSGTFAYMIHFRSLTNPDRGVLKKPGGISLLR